MKDDGLLTIGRLARGTGLPARTIRFYSDAGGHRRILSLTLITKG